MAKPRLSYTGHTYGMNNGGWFGLTQQQNPFSKMNVGSTVGALGAVAGQLGHSLIGGGYDADGVGNGIANIGGSIGGAISTVNPLVGGIVSAASGIVGGLTNRAFGTKENKANINAIEQNTTNMNQVGNALAGVGDSDSFFKMAGSMGSSSGFNTGDLVKGGWFSKGKARRKAQKYLNAENSALAFRNHGMALGAQGVDSNQDDDVMAHFAAYGGEIGPMGQIGQMGNYDNMGAIEYGLAADYIAAKNRKNEIDDKMPGMVGMPALNTFSEGGGIEIKHPGRLTALKKRTGKTEAELYNDGNPAHKKMVVFARNSRRWKKAYGGYLDAINNLNEAANLFDDGGVVEPDATYVAKPLTREVKKDRNFQWHPNNAYYREGVFTDKEGTPYILFDRGLDVNNNWVFDRRYMVPEEIQAFEDKKKKEIAEEYIAEKLWKQKLREEGKKLALGGDLQTNGADYPTGLTHIEAGLSHELNPNEGVQMGTDSQGTPNLVEENEVVWQDYVFSNRIPVDEGTKVKFHLPKKKEITYADLAKKLEKEISERPNDPISKAGFNAQMEQLEAEQERQKAEMEAERAREAFEAMSPEEQTALMQQVAQQEQMAQEQAMQEQAMAEQAQMEQAEPQQPVEEEMYAPEEMGYMPEEVPTEEMPEEGYAEGGNLYADGGPLNKEKYQDYVGKQPQAILRILREKYLEEPDDVLNRKANELYQQTLKAAKIGRARKWLDSNTTYSNSVKDSLSKMMADQVKTDTYGKYDYNNAFEALIPTHNFGKDNVEKYFKALIENGIDFDTAFDIVNARRGGNRTSLGVRRELAQLKKAFTDKYGNQVETVKEEKTAPSQSVTSASSYSTPYQEKLARQRAVAAAKTQRGVGNSTSTDLPIKEQQAQAANIEQASELLSNRAVAPSYEGSNYRVPGRGNNVVSRGNRGLNPYSYYTNGTDGIGEPTGFKVGNNGLIRQEDYTQEYRDLVNTLTANDIRQWAAEHPNDPSLLSFLAKGNKLENLTDEQWRKGATDGKYGFMHHVGDQILQDNLAPNYYLGELPEVTVTPNGNVVASSEVGDFAADKASGYPTADPSTYTASATAGDAAGTTEEDKDIIMNHRSTWPRYAGLFGPAVGLGMMAAGVGRPDYSALDAAVRMGTGDIRLADYKPLGDYLTYRPMDIWAEQNRLDANARATDRAIRNSGLPTATKNASLLANAYNNQIASSELYKKALEYNDAKEAQVKGFNRGTNQFNAEAYNKNSQFNANAMNRAKQYQANLALNAAAQKMNADAAWYNGIYGNLSGLFEGLGNLGRENYEYNQFVDYLGSGAVPGVTKKKLVDAGYAKWAKDGGKVQKKKNKKGLTF